MQDNILLTFPCIFPIKALGVNDNKLLDEVIKIIKDNCADFDPHKDITTKASGKGNYTSITATITAQSQQQLDAIYTALNQHHLVKVTL